MKKRILSILLLCCMLLTLLPTAAFAADTGKAIQLGTDALSKNVNTASAPTVYFGQDHENNPAAWRVIGYNGNGVASAQGDMTLLAAGNMSSVLQFADFGTNNRYASSYLKTAIDALAEKLTTEENTAVKKRTLTSGSYNGENTDCVAGEQVDNAVFWPLSTAEAFAVNQDLRIVDPEHPSWASSYWWLRSPGYSDHDAATVNGDGSVVYSGNAISSWWCVRPAFNLNSSSVLFTSAAVGGKPDGGLTPISKYTGNEWKLTLKDSNRNFAVTETTVSGDPGDTVTLHYTGATAGINEYISVILADNSGAQYYGRVAQPTAENGTVEIKIPSGLAPGSYTLKVFSEQCNDDKKTDYASDFVDIDLTVGYQEQFTLTPGGVYYFDLSGVSIPGTANGSLPDKTMHYVPFTYAGTVDAYKLTSEMATTEEYAQQNEYAHSLFVADYAVTHAVSWDNLNAEGLIFGKGYATGSVDYTLRAPSGGSGGTGSGALERGTPQSNEWDRILDKDDGYIKNCRNIDSWGQDTLPNTLSNRVIRGQYDLPRKYAGANTTLSFKFLGFRPVLEVLNPGTLGSDGLKAVTLDLGGGKFGGSSDTIQIIVKTGESFTAPASEGLTRPDGNTGSYFEWLGSDGELYAPDDNVPADVTKLTAQFVPPEQFNLAPGGTYYFDLSGVGIPGTVNDALPDNTLHYVPFTYAGTVDAYKLTSEMATTEEYAEQKKYPHSLFVADYAVAYAASWDHLNDIDMIFGKDYTAGGVDYTMRAPSEGSDYTGSGDSERGTPQSNEWDRLLDKDDGYIKNWNGIFSCGQDTVIRLPWRRTVRGHYSSRFCGHRDAAGQNPQVGFRPVLEVLNRDTIGPDGLKDVTLDLGGGKLGDESSIRIIVKNGSEFTAPASDGLTRPEGATGNYFKWLGSDGKLYAPGASVPEDVTTLTARFVPDTYTVIVTTDSLPDGKTGKAYSHTLTAIGAAPITWSIDEGALPAGLRLNEKTGEISGIPTAAGTATFTVKAENSEGSDTRALSITVNNAVEQTPVRYLDADGKERFCTEYTVLESVIIEDFFNSDNKWYDMPAGWYVVEGDVTITPRLDTHGAVNLILTDDCHLTVPWGINVKEGDTFTIYAQSTAEASMGKLTACLPELSDHEKSVWPVAGLSGIGAGVRVWAANDNFYENEGTIIINGGNIHAKGQQGSSAIGGSDYEHNVSSDGDTPGNLRQGGSITINGGVVRTEPFALPEGNPLAVDSVGIGTCQMGYGGSVTINGGTVIAEATCDAITTGYGGTITINGGDVTAIGGVNNFGENSHRVLSGNGIGPYESGSVIINGGTVKATAKGEGFGIGGARIYNTGAMTVTINGGEIEATANHNNAAIGDKGNGKSGVTINGGVIHAVGKGGAAGIGSKGDIRITGGELTVSAEGSGAAIGGFTDSYSERVDCKSITINGNAIKSISSKDGACIGAATGGSVGSITISDAELPLLSSNKILIGWDADSPGGKLTIRNCHVASTDELTTRTDGIRVGSNSELVIEESEIRLPHFRSIRVGGNGSIAVRDSDLHTYGIFMDENAKSPNDAKTLKRLEITDSTVLTGDIIGARGEYSSVEEIVIRGSIIRLNDEYTYNRCTIGGGEKASFGSIDIQDSQIDSRSSVNAVIGNGTQSQSYGESRIRIANSQVSVRNELFGPAIGAAYGSSGGQINILIENSTVTAKGGNLRSGTDYIPGIGKNSSGRASEIGKIQILNSTVESFRLEEKDGTNYVYDKLHTKELPGIPAENITICGSTVNGKTIDHSPDEYGKCALCDKYDLGYCYEHGLLTLEGLTDCAHDGSEKKLTGLSHQTGENKTKQLTENTDYTAIYSNNVHPYTLTPGDEGFDSKKAPKVTLYGTGNYCGKAEHYFTISENAAAAPTITTDTLPGGKVGEAYSQTLSATGTTPITWGIDSGNLPAGLTLDEATGEISGTPTAAGTASFTVKAENSAGSDTKELSITITKAAPAEYIVRFNANGGGGTMADVTGVSGSYTLPSCGFTEPEGKQFNGWSTSADGSVISGTTYEVSSDTTFYAIWESKEYSIIVTDGKATIGAGSEISKAAQGTTITLTANAAPDGKVFDKWVVESGSATLEDANSETTTFIMPDSEVSVKATYKNAPVTTYSLTTQVNGGHGTISASKTGLTEGSTETVTFTPDDGYEIDLVTVNGVVTDVLSNILNVTMDADKTVIVTYKAIPHTHTYDQEIQKPETLKSAADCTNDAVYFKSCSCGEISTTETFTAAGTQLGHAWASDWSKDTDNHWKICSRCHEKKDEAAHDYGSDNICDTCGYDKTVPHTHNLTLVPAKAPTCTEKGNTAYYTCDGCDKWFEDATGASEITDKTSVILAATGHSVSDWKSDHTDHWKECTVVGCGVIIEDSKAVHTAGEWIIDTPATATTSGSKHKECTVCGYTMTTETIPATGGGEHTHSYSSDWKYDADNHWHECSCGDKADKAAHDFKWVVDKEATATQKGSKHEECKVCGYKKAAVEILATGSTTKPTDPTQTNSNTGAEGPKTGDNSNMILWIALLFISGGAVIGITVYSKKKKENAE